MKLLAHKLNRRRQLVHLSKAAAYGSVLLGIRTRPGNSVNAAHLYLHFPRQ